MRALEVLYVLAVATGVPALVWVALRRRPRRWRVDTASRDGHTLVLLQRAGDEPPEVVKSLDRDAMDEIDFRLELEQALDEAAQEAEIRNRVR